MKKHILTFILTLAAIAINAQDQVREVEPGVDGPLPSIPTMSEPAAGTFGGLFLQSVGYRHNSGWIINGNWANMDAYEAYIYFVSPTELGGEYHTLQYRTNGGAWQNSLNSDGEVKLITSDISFLSPVITSDIDYRLVLHGGEKDGWVSNVISVKKPTVDYSVITRSGYSEPDFIGVGIEVDCAYIDTERQNKGSYNSSTGKVDYTTYASFYTYNTTCYHHQWYRMNPLSYEMIPIEGATGLTYTPTAADLGYQLIDVTTGDDQNISFYVAANHGIVQATILASIEYAGLDGFILNTNYILPNGGKDIEAIDWMSEDGDILPASCIQEVKPGQYAFVTELNEESGFIIEYADENYKLVGDYGEEGNPWYRFFHMFFGEMNMPIAATASVNTPIDVIGRDINGHWDVVATIDPSAGEEEEIYLISGKYYLRTQPTAGTLATYYPSALLWEEATAVTPGYDIDEDGYYLTKTYSINAKSVPPALNGSGVIEGTVNIASSAANAPRRASADASGISVYLQKKGGDIIACEETNTSGGYRFEKVPMGSYEVLVNVDGCLQEQTTEVTLTNDQPTVSDVDYYVNDDNTITTTPGSQAPTAIAQHATATTQQWYDLSGRRLRHPQPGVNIVKGTDGTVRRIIMR